MFIGLLLLLFVTIRSFRGHYSPEEHRGVEVPGIYWHFVDIMWIVVYTTVYSPLAAAEPWNGSPCHEVPPCSGRAADRWTLLRCPRTASGPSCSAVRAGRIGRHDQRAIVAPSLQCAAAPDRRALRRLGRLLDGERAEHAGRAVAGRLAEERVGAGFNVTLTEAVPLVVKALFDDRRPRRSRRSPASTRDVVRDAGRVGHFDR